MALLYIRVFFGEGGQHNADSSISTTVAIICSFS
jgi:hypothetical protein